MVATPHSLLLPRSVGQEPLRLNALTVAGVRENATESWGTLRIELANWGSADRDARVVVFYPEHPETQFAHDLFVPGQTVVSTWMAIGPASEQQSPNSRDLKVLLYDRTGGRERLILPKGEERIRSQPIFYRRREPTTAVFVDPVGPKVNAADPSSILEPMVFARAMREAAGLSESVLMVSERFLPALPEAFDGIDVVVLAGNQLGDDPVGRQGLRRWLQQGGTLVVLLDRVRPAVLAPLLGGGYDIQFVDRTPLNTIRIHRAADDASSATSQEFDYPIDMVRVIPGESDIVVHSQSGWPASFTRSVGRGRIMFTTIGIRGWYRARTPRDLPSRFEHFPNQPVSHPALGDMAVRFIHPKVEKTNPPTDVLKELLSQEIGYQVLKRRSAIVIFGLFLLSLIAVGMALRRSRRPELVAWIGPGAAVCAAIVFVAIGENSRQAVPPTIGIVEIVDAVPGTNEAAANGVFAVYRPDSGPVPLAADSGAELQLDTQGLEGQTRRRVVTGIDSWHWEDLNLPAGVRTGTFRSTIRDVHIEARARFGPNGVEGRLLAGTFRSSADGVIITSVREPLPIQFDTAETFAARGSDFIPPDQFLRSPVLTDAQQRRQTVYRRLLRESFPRHWEGRDLLLAWAEPAQFPFRVGDGDRQVGSALLAIPLELDRPPANSPVIIPRAFVPYSRMLAGRRQSVLAKEGQGGVELEIRFQLPSSVSSMTVERAQFDARVRTPGRQFAVFGHGDKGLVKLFEAVAPIDPVLVPITDPQFLRADAENGIRLTVRIGEPLESESKSAQTTPEAKFPPKTKGPQKAKGRPKTEPKLTEPDGKQSESAAANDLPWKIDGMGLEVTGRTAAVK